MDDNSRKKHESFGEDDFALLEEMLEMLSSEQTRRRERTDRTSGEAFPDSKGLQSPPEKIEPLKKRAEEQRPAEQKSGSGESPGLPLIVPAGRSTKPPAAKNNQEDLNKGPGKALGISGPEPQNGVVILESAYGTQAEYGEAVFDYMNRVLRNHGYQTSPRMFREGVRATAFSTYMQGVNVQCRVLCENALFSYRIECEVCKGVRPGRLPLIEHLMQGINSEMRYGSFISDKKEGTIKLVYSSCYHGAFIPIVFDRYIGVLLMTCREYCKQLSELAANVKLSDQAMCELRQMIGQSAVCLPMEVETSRKQVLYQQMVGLFGSSAPDQCYKLIACAIDQIPDGPGR